MLNGSTDEDVDIHALLWDVKTIKSKFKVTFLHAFRENNKLAHELARRGLRTHSNLWFQEFPCLDLEYDS